MVASRNELNILQWGRGSLFPQPLPYYYFFIKNWTNWTARYWKHGPGAMLPRWMDCRAVYAVQSGNSKTEKKLEIEPHKGRVSNAGEGNSMVSSLY
jgi:hypothetical protein